ncbi:GyrI-like domain-containing protein [Escherichia coli]
MERLGIRPPLRLGEFTMPSTEFIALEDTPLIGVTQSYSCSLEQISDFRHEMRYQFWHDFLGNAPTIPPVLYGLNERVRVRIKTTNKRYSIPTALAQDQADGYVLTGHPVMLQGGEYVMFTYEGLGTGVQEFILTVYGTCMPMLNLTRRKGRDISDTTRQKTPKREIAQLICAVNC